MTLVIRGAAVVDGLGHDPIRADVAIRDGPIAIGEVGKAMMTHEWPLTSQPSQS